MATKSRISRIAVGGPACASGPEGWARQRRRGERYAVHCTIAWWDRRVYDINYFSTH
jgi:hypothetical protein